MGKKLPQATEPTEVTTGTGNTDRQGGIIESGTSDDRGTGTSTSTSAEVKEAENSASENNQTYQTIAVKQPRKPRKDKGTSKAARAESGGNSLSLDQVSATMCATASAIAVAITQREDAAMQPAEMGLIQPALADTLRGMGERAKQAVDQYSGAVMLAAGLGLWALRLSQMKPAQPTAQPARQPRAPMPQPAKRNDPAGDDDPGHPPVDLYRALGSGADV